MIDSLLHALATSNLPLTDEEFADVLWLASYMDMPSNASTLVSLPEVQPQLATPANAQNRHQQPTKEQQAASTSGQPTASAQAEVHLSKSSTHDKQRVEGMRALSFRSPAATALPGKLALARALRPILRKIPSSIQLDLDEVATAEQAAEEGRITPQLRPGRERWFDVAVVIDDWHTMAIWQQTIAEFIELLQQLGAFRTLRTYLLSTKADKQIEQATLQLFTAQGFKRGRICSPGELLDSGGRRLTLVLTDCTSPAWYSGAAGQLLTRWGSRSIVTVVQMLPADLWNDCALADFIQIFVSATTSGTHNAQLAVEHPWYWDDIWDENRQTNMRSWPVPITTLEPEALHRWTRVVAGKGRSKSTAFYLSLQPTRSFNRDRQVTSETSSPDERWRRFRATASPMAQELAGYLSAAPLSLPVMRVVQRTMLQHSRQIHLAEILRSDLLYQVTTVDTMTVQNEIRYEFKEGLRKLLLTTVLLNDTKQVLEKASEFVSKHSEGLRKFHTLILDPNTKGEFQIDENSLPFVRIAVAVLKRLGGVYAQLATNLEDYLDGADLNYQQSVAIISPVVRSPYRGLEPFDHEHANNYFGREAMVERLVAKLGETNLVAVVGPSGSGKSSLVRAGLISALKQGALPGSAGWNSQIFVPTDDPLRAFATPLAAQLEPDKSPLEQIYQARMLANRIRAGELPVRDVLTHIRQRYPHFAYLFIIDQFEETFTLCHDEALRQTFINTILDASEMPEIKIIFTLRADFYGRALEYERLGKRIDNGLINVFPMTRDQLRAAIEKPVHQVGRGFEQGLVERILDDVADQAGALPSLQFALTELWERQTDEGVLTHTAYQEIGEVAGAIAKRANDAYRTLTKEDQKAVRKIFTRLVNVSRPEEDIANTRRRIDLRELDPSTVPLVHQLADQRLLVTNHDMVSGHYTVEVAHEALISNWENIQDFLHADLEFLLWRQRLSGAVHTWEVSQRNEGALWRGVLLAEAQGWLSERSAELNSEEQAFITASQAAAKWEVEEREAERQHIQELEQLLRYRIANTQNNSTIRSVVKRIRNLLFGR
jgi:hypothetical protein